MRAGFAKVPITPPIGTRMMGFGSRDREHGCTAIHDDIFVRAVYLEHAGEAALIMGFDLCFIGRADSDRFKSAIGQRLDLAPQQILLNTSHNHVGPAVGMWHSAGYIAPDHRYLKDLDAAVISVACQAQDAAREVTVSAGVGRSALPMSRRIRHEDGSVTSGPNPDGVVYDDVPICLLKDLAGEPVCLLFSVSCHPVIMSGFEVSAEYPGAAMDRLDAHLGTSASLFLQGAGADANVSVRRETWDDVDEAGQMVADEVMQPLEVGLVEIEPQVRTHLLEVRWPLQPDLGKDAYVAVAEDPEGDETRRLWAQSILKRIERGEPLPTSVPILLQGVQLGTGLRIIGVEGEMVAGLGILIRDFYGEGITFPLGYSNGEGLYMPTSDMIDEGGYEVVSYWEYGYPAPLAKGFESILTQGLEELRASGIE